MVTLFSDLQHDWHHYPYDPCFAALMILPLYSMVKAYHHPTCGRLTARSDIDSSFFQNSMPQTIPGVGAGGLLVFILAIGYYITPALVGGQDGQLISNMIAYHMQKSLNWSLAAALVVFC